MKRMIAIILAAAALFAAIHIVSAETALGTANARIKAEYAALAPISDGVISESEYGAPVVSYRPGDASKGVITDYDAYGDWGFDFYTVWDENALYLAWEVHGGVFAPIPDSVAEAYDGGLGHMWEYSCIQYMVTPGAPELGSTDYQSDVINGNYTEGGICLRENGNTSFIEWSYSRYSMNYGSASGKAVHDAEKGITTYELRLPWSMLGCFIVGRGSKVGLAFAVAAQEDFNKKNGMLEWQDAMLGGKNADAAAVLTLSGGPSPYKPQRLWLTHYNEADAEGAGVIFTEADTAGEWCSHVAFAPVKGEPGVYEIVDISFGEEGQGRALAIPEGGFVYCVNLGNNWPLLTRGLTGDGSSGLWYDDEEHINMPNYQSDNSVDMMHTVYRNWSVGLWFSFEGLDLVNFTVPTTTPDLRWYDEGYVCTATFTKQLVTDETSEPGDTTEPGDITDPLPEDPAKRKGHVAGKEKIGATDYAMVKRHYLKTYNLSEEQQQLADVNFNGRVDASDYAMIKRHVLNTFDLEAYIASHEGA